MARKTEIREIGSNRFRVTQLRVKEAHRVLTKITKIVGESLGALADNLGAEAAEAAVGDLAKGSFAAAMQKLSANLGDEDLNWLVEKLRPTIEFQNDALRESDRWVPMTAELWDETFSGALLSEFKVLAFALESNYADFFAGVGGLKDAARRFVTPTQSTSGSPTTANPGSGASS